MDTMITRVKSGEFTELIRTENLIDFATWYAQMNTVAKLTGRSQHEQFRIEMH